MAVSALVVSATAVAAIGEEGVDGQPQSFNSSCSTCNSHLKHGGPADSKIDHATSYPLLVFSVF